MSECGKKSPRWACILNKQTHSSHLIRRVHWNQDPEAWKLPRYVVPELVLESESLRKLHVHL